ncbi:MAG: protein tyrosine phosphatase [Clostridiales Family XIII bacterium]|jgi:predicted protein tyrosine phosphatase|nr:protein tyrosine phosphatase [Clostridiales Family XIII bacterium]
MGFVSKTTKNLLFVCTGNRDRSPTAAYLYKSNKRFDVKSAGTMQSAKVHLDENLIKWADIILVMESHHETYIREQWSEILTDKKLFCLDIPDDYECMSPQLINLIRGRMEVLFHKGEI